MSSVPSQASAPSSEQKQHPEDPEGYRNEHDLWCNGLAQTAASRRCAPKSQTEKKLSDFSQLQFRRICEDSRKSTMACTQITRRHFRRDGMRHQSDTTDAAWFVIEPLIPLDL
jgi:hypothetical protein